MIRSLKMLVLPLVAGCMVASVCALGEAGSGMGRTAAWTLGLFFATTCVAASLGVVLAVLVQPGHNGDLSVPGEPMYSVVGLDCANRKVSFDLSLKLQLQHLSLLLLSMLVSAAYVLHHMLPEA